MVSTGIVLKTLYHLLPLLDTATAMQEERTIAKPPFYHHREHVVHLAELGEDEYLLTTFDNTLQERE